MMTTMKNLYDIYKYPRLYNPPLVVGWRSKDIGNIGESVLQKLIGQLPVQKVAEIKPLVFSAMDGADFKDDLIQVPESAFWACEENNLLFFLSNEPELDTYRFLNLVLMLLRDQYRVSEIITVDGTPAEMSHLHPRRILAVFNGKKAEEIFSSSKDLVRMDWEGRPALSSYFIWAAGKEGTPGLSLWPEVPFYLAAGVDYRAIQTVLMFLGKRYRLELQTRELSEKAQEQNQYLLQLKESDSEVDELVGRLETGTSLDEQERVALAQKVYEFLEGKGRIL